MVKMDMTRQPVRTGPRNAHALGAAAVGIAAAALLLTGCESEAGATDGGISTVEVLRQNLEITADASGRLDPRRSVEIKSRASGEVIEVAVDVGDRVEPGTLLVRVDPRDVQSEFDQAEADYEVAQERFRNAEAEFRRSENLLARGVISEEAHEGRRLSYATARSQMIRAETALDLARVRLGDVTIRSRMHGTVLARLVEEGQVIRSAGGSAADGTLLLEVANLDVLQVRALVDESDVGRIEAGMPVTVTVDARSGGTFMGTVEKIEPQPEVRSNVVMYPVVVYLDNRNGELKPGMTAEVRILLVERPDALMLPNHALVTARELVAAGGVLDVPMERLELPPTVFEDLAAESGSKGDERVVFVVDDAGEIHPRAVLIGVSDWNNSEVLAGLEEGEWVALIGGQGREQDGPGAMMRMRGGMQFGR